MTHLIRTLSAFTAIILLLGGCASQRMAEYDIMQHRSEMQYSGIPDDALYTQIRAWLLEHCVWEEDVLQFEDAETHALMARGRWTRSTEYIPTQKADIDYTLSLEIEKGLVRFELTRVVGRASDDGEELPTFSNSERFHLDAGQRFREMLAQIDSTVQSSGRKD